MSFSGFNFNPQIQAALCASGFVTPTPIQAKGLPVVLAKRDMMGLAQTGTGKTAVFVLPMIEQLCKSKSIKPRALILVPTRELAQQVCDVVRAFGDKLGVRSTTIIGGANMDRQIDRIRKGVDVIVACPGRLLDHLRRRTLDVSKIETLVLDEADQMFDMGFQKAINQILTFLPKNRQTLMFSATMPQEIRRLAEAVLVNPVNIQVDQDKPLKSVSHAIYPVDYSLKTELLIRILKDTDTESVIVFVRTKHRAKNIARRLHRDGFNVTELQGNLSQGRRQEAMRGFRDGTYQILVATDIAARGIDISNVSHVINYDIPDTVEAYTHRIGRTGRAANVGDAFTLVSGVDTLMVRSIERSLGASLERRTLPDFNYQVGSEPLVTRKPHNTWRH